MSISILYHDFGIKGYDYVRSQFVDGCVWFKISQHRFNLCCSVCNCKNVIRRGFNNRIFRSLPIGKKTVFIEFDIPRIECFACGIVRQVKFGFTDAQRSYTKSIERFALDLSRHMTIQDVANHLGVSWDTIKEIQKRFLQKRFSKPKLNHLKRIAIDEISIGKGQRYLTVVLDLATGAVVFVAGGKGSEALIAFWRRLKASKAEVKAVAIDMSPAYIRAVRENLPAATIVFDHFHIIKNVK